MRNHIHTFFTTVTVSDPIHRRQAPMVQVMYLVLIVGALFWVPISLSAFTVASAWVLAIVSSASVVGCTALAFVLLRHGRFTASVVFAVAGIFLAVTIVLVITGLRQSGGLLLAYALPISLVGLLLGQRCVLIICGLCMLSVASFAVLELSESTAIGFGSLDVPMSVLGTVVLATTMLGMFLGSFGATLRHALVAALRREQELEQAQEVLQERTTLLHAAVQTSEQRQLQLKQTLDALQTSQTALEALSAPIIPVLPGVLVAPLIGTLDSARAATLTSNVLEAVKRLNARHVIFDITGVPVVDTAVVQTLLQTAAAIRLLGAEVLLVGIRPEVAQTIVASGRELGGLRIYTDLQGAITTLLSPQVTHSLPC
jgi:anti-anti-sigma factor